MLQPIRPEPQSRRQRPAKPPLSRESITETALGILESEGLDKVTMRRIAGALNTGPASLYVYFADTEELHAGMLDLLIAKVVKKRPSGTWRERLVALLEHYMALLFEHPALARMALTTPANGPNYLALVDALLGCLDEGHLPARESASAVDLLLLYATAFSAEHGTWSENPSAKEDMEALRASIGSVDAQRYPNVARVGEAFFFGQPGERRRFQVETLLNGIVRTRLPAGKKKVKS